MYGFRTLIVFGAPLLSEILKRVLTVMYFGQQEFDLDHDAKDDQHDVQKDEDDGENVKLANGSGAVDN